MAYNVSSEFQAGYDGTAILERLDLVLDPELDESILQLGFVRSVQVRDSHAIVMLQLPTSWCAMNFAYIMADDVRRALLAHTRALVVPSPYESLSIVLLEAWNYATPALVNAYCKVLQGQVRRASGGLYYRSSREFQEALSWLLANDAGRRELGEQGLAYVDREHRRPPVLAVDGARTRGEIAGGSQSTTISGTGMSVSSWKV